MKHPDLMLKNLLGLRKSICHLACRKTLASLCHRNYCVLPPPPVALTVADGKYGAQLAHLMSSQVIVFLLTWPYP